MSRNLLIIFGFVLGACVIQSAVAQEFDAKAWRAELVKYRQERAQEAAKQNAESAKRAQRLQEIQQRADEAITQRESGESTGVSEENQAALQAAGASSKETGSEASAAQSKQTIPMCKDCYASSDPNNYRDNFLYDNQGNRIQRIYPPCKCPASVAARPVTAQPTTTTTQSSGSGWKIHY